MWLALAIAASLYAAPGPDEAVGATLRWDAPPGCPSEAEMRAAVEARLGTPLSQLPLPSWSVVGTVTREPQGQLTLDLQIRVPDGATDRTLHDPHDCAALSDAAALLVALMLDPEAVAAQSGTATGPSEPVPPRPEIDDARREQPNAPRPAEPTPPTEPREPPRRRPPDGKPLDVVLGVEGGFDYGTARKVSPIGRAGIAWELPRLRVGAVATFGGSPGFTVPAVAQDVSLFLWTVGAEVGPVFRFGAFRFPLTAGLEGGQLMISPRALVPPGQQQRAWGALTITPGAAWAPRPWIAIVLRVGTTVPFVRPEFAIEGLGRVHKPAPVGIRGTLGLEFRLPLGVMKQGASGNPRERT